jgi:preprotein translocase subunit SecD
MLRGLKWRFILYAAMVLFAVLLVLPTLMDQLPPWYGKIIPSEKIHLGLDLQGGMHLILEVEAEKAVESYVERIRSSLIEDLKGNGIPFGKLEGEKNNRSFWKSQGKRRSGKRSSANAIR